MTQPAKGQEPSMEEILASIRRIIADDDRARCRRRRRASIPTASRPPRAAVRPGEHRLPCAAAVPPERATRSDEIEAMLAQLQAATRPPSAAEESGLCPTGCGAAAPMPDFPHHRRAAGRRLRKQLGRSNHPARGEAGGDAGSGAAGGQRARAPLAGRERGGRFRLQHARPDRAGAETAARSRIWCAKCCGRCSRPGSTTICRAWSSGWCAPRSSACRAGAADAGGEHYRST